MCVTLLSIFLCSVANLSILTPKIVTQLSGLFIPDPDPNFYPSRIQESKRHRIPDTQHCMIVWKFCTFFYFCIWFRSVHGSSSAMVFLYTEIHFISIGAKFGICAVVGLNGTLVKAKCAHSSVPNANLIIGRKKNLALYKPFKILWEKYPMGTARTGQELWRSGPVALHHTEHWQRGDSLSGIQAHTLSRA